MKGRFLEKIETKLSKSEVMERIKGITHEEKFFNIFIADDNYFCSGKFDEDTFSLFYLVKSRGDILLPRIHGEITESEEGSSVTVSYGGTWGWVFVFAFWSIWIWVTVKLSVLNIILHLLFYILGILIAITHVKSINKKSVEILKQTLSHSKS